MNRALEYLRLGNIAQVFKNQTNARQNHAARSAVSVTS